MRDASGLEKFARMIVDVWTSRQKEETEEEGVFLGVLQHFLFCEKVANFPLHIDTQKNVSEYT